MTAKILIGGATGTNGVAIIKALTEMKVPVRALVRNPARSTGVFAPEVEVAAGDYSDTASLTSALKDIELAYFIGSVHHDYVTWFENFLAAAQRCGVRRVVKFSGMTSSPTAESEIIRMHATTDQMLIDSGLSYTILRPNSFHQNMLMYVPTIKDQGKFYLNMGAAKQSHIDVRDIASVGVAVLTETGHEDKIYDLTGPEALTYLEVAATLSTALGRKITYVPISDEDAKNGMLSAGMPEWTVGALVELFSYFASGAAEQVNTTVKDITGRDPITFDQFAKDFAGAFK